MAMYVRSRRLTEPFNEKVRARIFGFGSRNISNASSTSGSEHDACTDLASSASSTSTSSTCSASPCLSYLVQNFLENSDGVESSGAGDPSSAKDAGDSEDEYLASDPTALIRDKINPLVRSNEDRFRTDLLAHVSRAVEAFALFRGNHSLFNRNVMAYLRQIGYNAGVCKTKWEATPGGGLAAGNYEFIDVLLSSPSPDVFSQDPDSRYIIDLNFFGQFEIARATDCYRRLLGALPRVFVGKSDDLKRIVRLMADETRRSMKINGISLSPWRKNRYMQAKWFGPYRRTVNQLHVAMSSTASHQAAVSGSAVKCRSVGFFTSAVIAPPTTRTR